MCVVVSTDATSQWMWIVAAATTTGLLPTPTAAAAAAARLLATPGGGAKSKKQHIQQEEEARKQEAIGQEEAEGLCGGGAIYFLLRYIYIPPHKGLPATYHPGARPGVQRDRCMVVVLLLSFL
jgi:hypothetical protein